MKAEEWCMTYWMMYDTWWCPCKESNSKIRDVSENERKRGLKKEMEVKKLEEKIELYQF